MDHISTFNFIEKLTLFLSSNDNEYSCVLIDVDY